MNEGPGGGGGGEPAHWQVTGVTGWDRAPCVSSGPSGEGPAGWA